MDPVVVARVFGVRGVDAQAAEWLERIAAVGYRWLVARVSRKGGSDMEVFAVEAVSGAALEAGIDVQSWYLVARSVGC